MSSYRSIISVPFYLIEIPAKFTLQGNCLQPFATITSYHRILGKLYVTDLANDAHCNFPPEAFMNTVSSYEAANWLERISYNFLIYNMLFLFTKPLPLFVVSFCLRD